MSEMRGAMAPDAQQLANVAAATYNPLFGPPPALAGTGAADPGVQQLATVGQPPPQAADDLDKDPIFGRMLRGETIPPAAAAAPSGGPAGGPAGPVSGGPPGPAGPSGYPYQTQVPPVPEGYQPVFNPMAMRQLAIQGQAAGVQLPAVEKDLATYDGGDQLYYNPQTGHSYLAPYAYGPKDPGRQAYEAQLKAGATATGMATGEAPYKQVTIKTTNAQGAPVELTMGGDDAARYLHGLGPGAPAGGPAGGPPPGPAQAPPGVSVPSTVPGAADVSKRLQDLQTNADQAQQEMNTVLNMRDIMTRGLATGWTAEWRANFARALNAVPGIDPDAVKSLAGIDPANADMFQKQALRLSTEGVRTLGAREPGSIVQMFTRAYPSLETQPGALDAMTNVLRQEQQRILDKRDFMVDALKQSPAGGYGPLGIQGAQLQAERNFDQTNPARNYLRSAYLMTGTRQGGPTSDWYKQAWTPDTYTKDAAGHITLTPTGRAMLQLVPQGESFYGIDGQIHPRQ